jgi:hypothetical protein
VWLSAPIPQFNTIQDDVGIDEKVNCLKYTEFAIQRNPHAFAIERYRWQNVQERMNDGF